MAYTFRIFVSLLIVATSISSAVFCGGIHPKREFRAVWIASVVNIDWPRKSGLSVDIQKRDFIEILDFYQRLNFNTVIVQIRAAGDAFYASSYEPWSKYLTGREGQAPEPFYDPLQWMIKQAHERGFEFHAWFNPYRATFDLDTLALDSTHAYFMHNPWMVKYGKRYYFDPGLPEVRKYTTNVIMEVVHRYDVDAVHFDDYFYPYKIRGEVFNDSITFKTYANGISDIEDWRRANVDSLIKKVSDSIREVKPWVQLGISPFGVWRNRDKDPNGSPTQAGQTTYDDLYADPILWSRQKWIDYVVPQIYWSAEHPTASHRKLVHWWAGQALPSNVYIGHALYKVKNSGDKAWKKYQEIPRQIELTRNLPAVDGSVFFSAKSILNKHRRLIKMICRKNYKYPALVPVSPFSTVRPPESPTLQKGDVTNDTLRIVLDPPKDSPAYRLIYAVKRRENLDLQDPKYIITKIYRPADTLKISLKDHKIKGNWLAITSVDRYGQESRPLILRMDRGQVWSE